MRIIASSNHLQSYNRRWYFTQAKDIVSDFNIGCAKSMQTLIDAYVALIMAYRRTINDIQPHLHGTVLADLNTIGLNGYGNPLPNPSP